MLHCGVWTTSGGERLFMRVAPWHL